MVFKKGYKQTPEHKRRISEAVTLQHKINNNYAMKGKKHTKETKKKMHDSSIGRTMSDEAKKNWKESMDKLRQEGKLVVWNKGLTPRKGKYKSMNYQSHKVWASQKENLPFVPKGMVIHHLNLNPTDNRAENLLMLERKMHHSIHNKMCLEMRKK